MFGKPISASEKRKATIKARKRYFVAFITTLEGLVADFEKALAKAEGKEGETKRDYERDARDAVWSLAGYIGGAESWMWVVTACGPYGSASTDAETEALKSLAKLMDAMIIAQAENTLGGLGVFPERMKGIKERLRSMKEEAEKGIL